MVVRGAPDAVDDRPTHIPLLPITGNAGSVPLGSISDTGYTVGPSVVTHYNGHRSATISGSLAGRDAGAIGERVDAIVANTPLPPGISVRSGGTFSDIREEFSNVYVGHGHRRCHGLSGDGSDAGLSENPVHHRVEPAAGGGGRADCAGRHRPLAEPAGADGASCCWWASW